MSIDEFNNIIKICRDRINKSTQSSSSNYRNLVNAYIHSASKQDETNESYDSNLAFSDALQYANSWRHRFNDEPDSHYYYGVLKLVDAIDKQLNERDLKEANNSFSKCREIYKNMKDPWAPHKFRKPEFLISNKKGLKRLAKFDEKLNMPLEEFEEDVQSWISNGKAIFKLNRSLDLTCLARNSNEEKDKIQKAEIGQHPRYRFNLSISRSDLRLFKFKRIN